MKPRTLDDCPQCVRACEPATSPVSRAVRPWREVKGSRGRPKRLNTAGYACDNERREYCGITDASMHALVGYGHHGVDNEIQGLFCHACGHKFSVRRHTAPYRLKTPARRVAEVLATVAEGLSVAAAGRVFGHAERTFATLLTRARHHGAGLHTQLLTGLELLHVKLDELRTTLRNRGQAVWLWLASDARTKIIAAVELGPRTQTTGHALIHGLMHVLACGCIPLFTSDALNLYFYSLTAHFGSWAETPGTKEQVWQVAPTLLYGQLIKSFRRRKLVRVARVMRLGTSEAVGNRLRALGWRGDLQTALVERVNLTIRRGLAMFARRSWATAQTLAHLQDGSAWWRGIITL